MLMSALILFQHQSKLHRTAPKQVFFNTQFRFCNKITQTEIQITRPMDTFASTKETQYVGPLQTMRTAHPTSKPSSQYGVRNGPHRYGWRQ